MYFKGMVSAKIIRTYFEGKFFLEYLETSLGDFQRCMLPELTNLWDVLKQSFPYLAVLEMGQSIHEGTKWNL